VKNLALRRVKGIVEQLVAPGYSTCKRCKRPWKFAEPHDVSTGPGRGHFDYCEDCWNELPESQRPVDWYEAMGISGTHDPNATFVRYVGEPHITDSRYGQNAFGSVLAEYSDGSRIGVICGHGGSAWLCLDCAKGVKNDSDDEKRR